MGKMDLKSILKEKTGGDILLHEIEAIKEKAIPLLNQILVAFSEYTPHDISHSEIVLKRMNDVIPDNLKEKLRPYEIYFLILSAYLHDLGMAQLGYLDIPETIKGNSKKLKEYIRDNHHIRSEKYINDNYKNLEIPDINQAIIIGKICRGHRKENLDNKSLFDPKQNYKSETINIPFLASVLRVSDELDITFERIPYIVYEMDLIKNPISKSEWQKHLNVAGVDVDPEDPLIIRGTATCKNPEIHRMLKQIERKINDQLEIVHNHLYYYREYTSSIPWKFILKINADGYKHYDFKFSLRENEILKLLIGEGFYKRKEECIRELLKNCVDTCRYKSKIMIDEEGDGADYHPTIIFDIATKNDILIVSDNGFGMDEYIIENYLTRIGKSFYNSPDFQGNKLNFSPVSELGIGFLSCFMIADRIQIETKTIYSDPLLIDIDNISNYFFVRAGTRTQSGTKITLHLKENARQMKIKEELEYYARHIEIPIQVMLPNSSYIIKEEQNKPYFKVGTIKGYSALIISNELSDVGFKGTIGILLINQGHKLALNSNKYILKKIFKKSYHIMEGGNALICNNGVRVCNISPVPEWLSNDVVFQDIDLKANILDLNLSRNQIKKNEKFVRFSNSLENIIIPFLISLSDMMELSSKEERNNFITMITDSGFNYVTEDNINYYQEERSTRLISENKRLLDLLQKFYSFRCFSDQGPNLMSYSEIIKIGKKVKILKYTGIDRNYIQNMLFNPYRVDKNNLYIMQEHHDLVDAMIEQLFGSKLLNFYDLFEIENVEDIEGIFPDRVNIIDIKNSNTNRLISHVIDDGPNALIYININNRFVKLIYKNRKAIRNKNKNLVKELFRYLLEESNINMSKVSDELRTILIWFKEQNLIKEKDFYNYLFTPEDFKGSAYPYRTEHLL